MHVKLVKAAIPKWFHADNSGSNVLLWCCVFGYGHSVAYGLVCFCVVSGSVLVAEWPPFEK